MKFLILQTDDALDLELPEYKSRLAAGVDLMANVHEDVNVAPGDIALVGTGIKIALPEGFEAQIRPRSGLALRYGVSLVNTPGTVDADYRGEIKVVLINHGKESFVVKRGMRIAQMVISKVELVEWETVDVLPDSERGEGGFGHTGR